MICRHLLNRRLLKNNHIFCRLLSVGDAVETNRVITSTDVQTFAALTGDFNPIHLDPEAAKNSRFGKCIVHGALLNGIVSGVIATQLPGPGTVLVSQSMEFTSPLFVGENVKTNVTITNIRRSLVECEFKCEVVSRELIVMKGSAKLYLAQLPKKS
ncbi:hypothetical protein CHUAL_001865 [Chamberlinius hualienensis]